MTALWTPKKEEMYPNPPRLWIQFGDLETRMEGAGRKGHFQGVALVVAKLLHVVQPDLVYFGQKDLQQCYIVKALIEDLNFNTQMRVMPIVRDKDCLLYTSPSPRDS